MKRPVLLEKCRRLRRTLEAATVPIENGRCLRDGFDAQTLSEAVDEMYSAACCVYEMLLANATRTTASPTGIIIRESASPDGPFTPIPPEAIERYDMKLGKDGISSRLVSAIIRLIESMGFQPDRWNAMQQVRPGHDHNRFRAGDVIPQEDLDLLQQAEELLELEEESNPGWDADVSLDGARIVKVINLAPHPEVNGKQIPQTVPNGVLAKREPPNANSHSVEIKELSLSEAALLYADLTGTKPDKGNTRRRLRDANGKYTIEHIALKARNVIKRKKSKAEQRQLMDVSESPQPCTQCATMVYPPDVLWGSGRVCKDCKYEPGPR